MDPGNRNPSQPRAALCWQAGLPDSVSRKGFFVYGKDPIGASYSSTAPELQGGEGRQESLMQPPETFQDDWNRKGSNAAGSIIASGFGRLLPYSSEKERNRDGTILCMHLSHFFIQLQAETNIPLKSVQISKCLKIQQGFCIVMFVFNDLLFNFCPSKPFDKGEKKASRMLFSQKQRYFKLKCVTILGCQQVALC